MSVLVAVAGDEPPDLTVSGLHIPVPPRWLADFDVAPVAERLWRYDFAVPRGVQDTQADYGFRDLDRRWALTVPGTLVPHRIVMAATGLDGGDASAGLPPLRETRWGALLGSHRAEPFHLLVLIRPPFTLSVDGPALAALPERLDRHHYEQVKRALSAPEPATLLASLPSLTLADGPESGAGGGRGRGAGIDIPAAAKAAAAERTRRRFALATAGDAPETLEAWPAATVQALRLDGTCIVLLDGSPRPGGDGGDCAVAHGLAALPEILNRHRGCRHLLLVTSTPPLFPGPGFKDRLLSLFGSRTDGEAGLRSPWREPEAAANWARLLRLAMEFARESKCRLTLVSGGVPVIAAGRLTGLGGEVRQLLTSGLEAPAVSGGGLRRLEAAAAGTEIVPDGLALEMLPLDGSGRRMLPARAWLVLQTRLDGALTATWATEGPESAVETIIPAG